jgi:hypothetical protein
MDSLQFFYLGVLVVAAAIYWFKWEEITGRPRPRFRKTK